MVNTRKGRRAGWWDLAASVGLVGLATAIVRFSLPIGTEQAQPPAPLPLFDDVTPSSGVRHTYQNGEGADHYTMLETLGGGCSLFDFDNDGLLDIYLAGGGDFGGPERRRIDGLPGRLYRNLGGWKFEDVTAAVGLDGAPFYSHGAAAADFDRDGWADLLVTGYGRVALYRNEPAAGGGRRLRDITRQAGLGNISWATSAAWGDLDGDGWPDLYVCQYLDWSWENHPDCTYDRLVRDTCSPRKFTALPHRLYRNNGDGTFADVGASAGLRAPRADTDYARLSHHDDLARGRLRSADQARDFGKGLGVLMVDFDGDGRPDVYVANDTTDNFLYLNRSAGGKVLLTEDGLAAGVARDGNGTPNGSMGLDAADVDGSGRPSLFVTNYEGEVHALYLNECAGGKVSFHYVSQPCGLQALGMRQVGWGTQFLDFDHAGWQGLFLTNGHILRAPTGAAKQRQRPVLLRNAANPSRPGWRRFVEITSSGGPYFEAERRGRGAAFGDLDNDGRIDVVLNHLNEPAAVLRNVAPAEGRHWLGIELRGKGRRCLVGTKVTVEAGGRAMTRFCRGGGSYLSSHDGRLTFGLGDAARPGRVTVHWSHGQAQQWSGLTAGRYWRLTEGESMPE
jgi:hypothetical protein